VLVIGETETSEEKKIPVTWNLDYFFDGKFASKNYPRKLTWQMENPTFEDVFLIDHGEFPWGIFHCHVTFREGMLRRLI